MSIRKAWVAPDAIDTAPVSQRRLYTGQMMPRIGLGTFESDHVPYQAVTDAVKTAASVGYRHFDCASICGNEAFIGNPFREIFVRSYSRRLSHAGCVESIKWRRQNYAVFQGTLERL